MDVQLIREMKIKLNELLQANVFVTVGKLFADEPHSDEACALLEEYLTRQPDDHVAKHHLAVHYHSRAFAMGEDPQHAQALFSVALEKWRDLHECDEYWDMLRRRGLKYGGDRFDPDDVELIRSSLPLWLLQVHATALKKSWPGNWERTELHMNILLEAPFAHARDQLRAEIFDVFDNKARDAMAAGSRNEGQDEALAIYEAYLVLDPKYGPGNREALRLVNKAVLGLCQEARVVKAKNLVLKARKYIPSVENNTELRAVETVARYYALRAYVALCHFDSADEAQNWLHKSLALLPSEQVAMEIQTMVDTYLEGMREAERQTLRGDDTNAAIRRANTYANCHNWQKAIEQIQSVKHLLDQDEMDRVIANWRQNDAKARKE